MKHLFILLAVLLYCGTAIGQSPDKILTDTYVETVEIETHLHHNEAWFEIAASVTASDKADTVGTVGGGGAWQLDAGNDAWSGWTQVLGSSDTPLIAGKTYYDFHELLFTDNERTALYFVQVAFGATAEAAYAAGDYSTTPYYPSAANTKSGIVDVQTMRHAAGTLCWVRIMCDGQNTATLDFIFGLHEYDE